MIFDFFQTYWIGLRDFVLEHPMDIYFVGLVCALIIASTLFGPFPRGDKTLYVVGPLWPIVSVGLLMLPLFLIVHYVFKKWSDNVRNSSATSDEL